MSDLASLDAPVLGDLEKAYLCQAVDDGFVSTAGAFVPAFEAALSGYLGVPAAAAVQSGTAALHLALLELGIGPGDEVILPSLTFAGTVHAVVHAGGRPVFAEVDPGTWTLAPESVERLLSPRTRALLPVHLFGVPCDLEGLLAIARSRGLPLVEDAAESLGATKAGRPTGTWGDLGCFSFNGNKVLTTGGGGLVVGQDPRKVDHIRFLANQAREAARGYFHPEVGYNYRMTNLEAALGLAQFERLEAALEVKRRTRALYAEALGGVPGLVLQDPGPEASPSWWLNAVLLPPGRPVEEVRASLRERGVPSRRFFQPLHTFPPYQGLRRDALERTEALFDRGLCLPSSARNDGPSIQRVADTLLEVLG